MYPNQAIVAIVKGRNPVDMVVEALGLINAGAALAREERILLKPNYIDASHPLHGDND